ncbi:MAG: hypothetical protein H7Y12_05730 [Sphingobacteriaceae bacterium]|nr:hypothetical protein [Cytophagaceae bacterium]
MLRALVSLLYANALVALKRPDRVRKALAYVQCPNWHGIGAFGLAAALVFRHECDLYFFRVMKLIFTRRFACFLSLSSSSSGGSIALHGALVAVSFPPQAIKPTIAFCPGSPLLFRFGVHGKKSLVHTDWLSVTLDSRTSPVLSRDAQFIGKPRPVSTKFRSGWQGESTFAAKSTPAVSRLVQGIGYTRIFFCETKSILYRQGSPYRPASAGAFLKPMKHL